MLLCSVLTLSLLVSVTPLLADDTPLPNVILIVTDDQDVVLKGMVRKYSFNSNLKFSQYNLFFSLHFQTPMKNVLTRIAQKGATFTNAFTSSPICCPSRSSILSGQYAHNCATFNNSIAGGCYGNFWREHVEQRTIAAVANSIGMKTFFAGKYLNEVGCFLLRQLLKFGFNSICL